MLLVFNSLIVSTPVFGAVNVVNSRATSAALEIADEIEWLFLAG